MTPHQTETDRNKVANSPWINISSVAKLNGYFDTKSLLSPTEQIVDDYDTLTAADLADFVLENSIFGYWQPVDFPILDEVGQDQTDLGVFEIWSSGSVPPPIKVTRKQGLKLHEWYNYFSDFSGQLRKCSEKELRYQVAVGVFDCLNIRDWIIVRGQLRGSFYWGYISLIPSYLIGN